MVDTNKYYVCGTGANPTLAMVVIVYEVLNKGFKLYREMLC
jgi:hypothetical protein